MQKFFFQISSCTPRSRLRQDKTHGMHAVVGFITSGRRFERRVCAVQKYEPPSGELAQQIEKDFGSLDKLVAEFNPKTAAIQVRS